jgi:hypothetical protein
VDVAEVFAKQIDNSVMRGSFQFADRTHSQLGNRKAHAF